MTLGVNQQPGAGQEDICQFNTQSVTYDIGVHYVDDLDFGLSDATVTSLRWV